MRITADPRSPYWSPIAMHCTVYLDGECQRHCVLADEEGGAVYRHRIGLDGKLAHGADGEFQFEAVRGDVSVVYPGMSFDVWMRDRTERAHAEFMTRTSRLPA